MQATILVACLLGHLAFGLWLARLPRGTVTPDTVLEVEFITATPAVLTTPPPFPVAPARPLTTRREPARATPSAPPDRSNATAPIPDHAPVPDVARLLDAAEAAARAGFDQAIPNARDPLRHHRDALPGRAESYTSTPIVLRRQIAPADVVAAIGGMLFGGNYDPCPDTRSKLRDLAARNDPRDLDEIRILVDRERRTCRR